MDLTTLHPDLQPLCQQFFEKCGTAGIKARINRPMWRDAATQQALYDKGLSNAPAGHGKHEFTIDGKPASKAFDFSLFTPEGRYITDGSDHLYARAGEIGKSIGLIWGGDWHHPDYDHMEL